MQLVIFLPTSRCSRSEDGNNASLLDLPIKTEIDLSRDQDRTPNNERHCNRERKRDG